MMTVCLPLPLTAATAGSSQKCVFGKCVRRAGSIASHAGRRIFFQPLHMLNIQCEVNIDEGRGRGREGMEGVRKRKGGEEDEVGKEKGLTINYQAFNSRPHARYPHLHCLSSLTMAQLVRVEYSYSRQHEWNGSRVSASRAVTTGGAVNSVGVSKFLLVDFRVLIEFYFLDDENGELTVEKIRSYLTRELRRPNSRKYNSAKSYSPLKVSSPFLRPPGVGVGAQGMLATLKVLAVVFSSDPKKFPQPPLPRDRA